jgi:hypothetical protein
LGLRPGACGACRPAGGAWVPTTVLGGVQGALARLGGSAALDPASARWSGAGVGDGRSASGGGSDQSSPASMATAGTHLEPLPSRRPIAEEQLKEESPGDGGAFFPFAALRLFSRLPAAGRRAGRLPPA